MTVCTSIDATRLLLHIDTMIQREPENAGYHQHIYTPRDAVGTMCCTRCCVYLASLCARQFEMRPDDLPRNNLPP